MVDDKDHYLFGRNLQMTDFCIDHASCSRVHAALIYHKILDRFFLMDLGSSKYLSDLLFVPCIQLICSCSSAHGSFIGQKRLEPNTPTQLLVDSTFHFGASTRMYTLREKPKGSKETSGKDANESVELPESEYEIDVSSWLKFALFLKWFFL